MESEKPKRQLTEAQRLAFLKGREKRLANIEKRRQEKIEQLQEIASTTDTVVKASTELSESMDDVVKSESHELQETQKTKRKYTRKPKEPKNPSVQQEEQKNDENDEHESGIKLSDDAENVDDIPTITENKVEPVNISNTDPYVIDHDLLADKIVSKMNLSIPPPPKLQRQTASSNTRKPPMPMPQKPQVIFNWM